MAGTRNLWDWISRSRRPHWKPALEVSNPEDPLARPLLDTRDDMADHPPNQAYGLQSDAFHAESDVHRRSVGKERKLSAKDVGDDGGVNAADDLLAAMGYKAEMVRSRSTLQVAFMSFVLASIPYGLSTTFYYPLAGGGPANIIWGWLAVSLIVICVAISLGEITSVFPTSGGVYYQTFMLAPKSYRLIISWICGWSFVVGNITITLAVNFGTTLFLAACINVFESEPGVGIFAGEPYQIFLMFVGITLLCNAVCSLANKWLPFLDVRRASPHYELHRYLPRLDFCDFLDICWCDMHNRVRARHCEERSP
jgi:hypothetical protein